MQNILNSLGVIGLISTGSLVGSLITILIKHFLDKDKLKTEREFILGKEIYFNLQKATERFFKNINLLSHQAHQISNCLSSNSFSIPIVSIDFEKRLEELSFVQVYFSTETCKKWDECVKFFREIMFMYSEVKVNPPMKKEQQEVLKVAYDLLNTKIKDLRVMIYLELEKIKESVV